MPFYQNAVRDERVREYVPAVRILAQENAFNPEIWIGNTNIQPALASLPFGTIGKGGSVLLDFGIELHGGIRIVTLNGEGKIRVRFGESVGEANGTPNQDHAIHNEELQVPKWGMTEYGNSAFRFVRIDNIGDSDLPVLNIIAAALFRDLEYAGSFESSDERLNRIWKTAAYTLQLNMQDYIYDGAKRDRLVWMGDMHPEIRGILAAFKDTSLIRKSLEFLVSITPLPNPMNNINTYSCWWVISLADYYRVTGDFEYIDRNREYLIHLLKLYSTYISSDGTECIPESRFLDWPNNDNPAAKHAGLQGLLLWMFRAGEELLNALGCDASFAAEARKLLKQHIPDCGENKSAAALQTVSGLADRSEVVQHDPFRGVSTFYGFYMLLAQPTVPAMELIRRYWGAMLDRGATTFWEDFDLAWLENSGRIDEFTPDGKLDLHADFGAYCYKGLRHSLCHGWSCGPMPFLSERISGIRFQTPGGTKVSIQPDLGDLEFAKIEYPTPRGKISVELNQGSKPVIQLPEGTELCGSSPE